MLKDQLWQTLNKHLTIKDLGEANWTLQMKIKRDQASGKLQLSQEAFTVEVLRRFNMSDCKICPTPAVDYGDEAVMRDQDIPTKVADRKAVEDLPFMELVGCLWWLAQMTRPDILMALQQASKWTTKPSMKLWRWLMRILKYLAGTTRICLTFNRGIQGPALQAFFDAAFANEHECRSTAGWVMYMHGSLIGYETATIKRVVLSSTEAECNAMMLLGKENIWQRRLYKELMGIQELQPTQVKGDNAASLLLLDSGVTKRSKHFAIEWFKVKELVEEKEMEVEWVDGEHNLADFFTKKLPTTRFISLRNQIMQCDSEPVIVRCVYDEECGCNGQLDQHRWWAELNADVFMGEPQAGDYDTLRTTSAEPDN